jgi:hypothetical protein
MSIKNTNNKKENVNNKKKSTSKWAEISQKNNKKISWSISNLKY